MKIKKEYQLSRKTITRVNDLIDDKYILDLLSETTEFLDTITTGDDIPDSPKISFPGAINVELEPLKMSGTLEVIKPVNSDKEISFADVKQALDEFGHYFSSNVNWTEVHNIYSRVFEDNEIVPPTVVVKGVQPITHIPEHILLEDKLNPNYTPELNKQGDADYHNIHALIFVDKDEIIGATVDGVQGIPGKSLDSLEIPFKTVVINTFALDDNSYIKDNKIHSKIDGTLKIVDNLITITPCLAINSDIDYHTGDVKFGGDIEISGSVRAGFNIISGGDILIKKSLEPANITCKNDLFVNQGIFGNSEHEVIITGRLITKHLENAQIKAIGNIEIEKCIINSDIYTNGAINMGQKGIILGHKIYSLNGINTFNIGNESGIHSDIYLGVDYIVFEKLQNIQKASKSIKTEMINLQHEINRLTTREERDKVKYLFLCLKNRLNSLNNHSRTLLQQLDINDKSTIEVSGTIYPGTRITICHVTMTITTALKKVTIYLNKEQGRIEWKSS